jgi:light-regulated signal transduction histidine kinase (bacteriophytochrome)
MHAKREFGHHFAASEAGGSDRVEGRDGEPVDGEPPAATELDRLVADLTAENQILQRFNRIASHELREPLRTLSGFCAILSKDYGPGLDERGRNFLQLATEAAERMQALLSDLAQLNPTDMTAVRAFEAGQAVDEALADLGAAAAASGARVERGVLPRLWGRPTRFRRLMQNLIANAIAYVAPGVEPRVRIAAERTGAHWLFAVSDNGVGIEEAQREAIFEPFRRLAPKDRTGGQGLGLAICRQIVGEFGGRIWVASEVGRGSTFYFTVEAEANA